MADIFGKALQDYQKGQYTEDIKTYSSLDEEDVIPLPYLFRTFNEMPHKVNTLSSFLLSGSENDFIEIVEYEDG